MKRSADGRNMLLSTGREIYDFGGIIGVDDDTLTYGFDGYLDGTQEDCDDPLTPAEIDEICDHTIAKWQAFRAKRGTRA